VIVYPPLSDGLEITVVKPIKKLSLDDYNLDKEVLDWFKDSAK
jgi:ATPase